MLQMAFPKRGRCDPGRITEPRVASGSLGASHSSGFVPPRPVDRQMRWVSTEADISRAGDARDPERVI